MFHADNQFRIGTQGQILQCFLQVTRTYFAGSTGAVYGFRQSNLLMIVHRGFLERFNLILHAATRGEKPPDTYFSMEFIPYLYKKNESVKQIRSLPDVCEVPVRFRNIPPCGK
jgi:hypothetical protein